VEEGIVPGGGVAFLRTIHRLDALELEDDEAVGAEIIRRALEEPVRQIVNNAGLEGSVVVHALKESDDLNFGFNAETEEFEDMVKVGVIDPTKVTRIALQNAASISGLLLTTECVISELPEKEKPMPAPPPGGGMGGMY